MTALTASSFLYEPTETLTDRNTDHIEAQRLIQSTVEELVPIKIPVNGKNCEQTQKCVGRPNYETRIKTATDMTSICA